MFNQTALFILLILSGFGLCLFQLNKISNKVNAIAAKLDGWERDIEAGFKKVTSSTD